MNLLSVTLSRNNQDPPGSFKTPPTFIVPILLFGEEKRGRTSKEREDHEGNKNGRDRA